jgi:hypothetical protein
MHVKYVFQLKLKSKFGSGLTSYFHENKQSVNSTFTSTLDLQPLVQLYPNILL